MITKEHNSANIAGDLEVTQIISWDDLQEQERLQLAPAPKPANQRRTIIASGTVLTLVATLLAVILIRAGGYF